MLRVAGRLGRGLLAAGLVALGVLAAATADAQSRRPPSWKATDVVIVAWPSAVDGPARRQRTRLLVETLAGVWGTELTVSLSRATSKPLGAVLRLPHDPEARREALRADGPVTTFFDRLAAQAEGADPSEELAESSRDFDASRRGRVSNLYADGHGTPKTRESLLVVLHAGQSDKVDLASRWQWDTIIGVDVDELDLSGTVLRACELVATRERRRCSRGEPPSMVHPGDASVAFVETGDGHLAVEAQDREGERVVLTLAADGSRGALHGRVEWSMPSTVPRPSFLVDGEGHPDRVDLYLEEPARELIRKDVVVLQVRIDGDPVEGGVEHWEDGHVTIDLPELSAGEHSVQLAFRATDGERSSPERAVRLVPLDRHAAGELSRCVDGSWKDVKARAVTTSGDDEELCMYAPWWSREDAFHVDAVGADGEVLYVGGALAPDSTWPPVAGATLLLIALGGLAWAGRRAKPTHLAIRITERGDFRNAPERYWATKPLAHSGPIASLHPALDGSDLSVTRLGAWLRASAGTPVVIREERGEVIETERFAVGCPTVVVDGDREYAFVDAETAEKLEEKAIGLPVPSRAEIASARAAREMAPGAQARRTVAGWMRRLGASVVIAAVPAALSFGAALLLPMLSQRGPFVAFTAVALGAMVVSLRWTGLAEALWHGPRSRAAGDGAAAARQRTTTPARSASSLAGADADSEVASTLPVFLWSEGASRGPFTVQELQTLWNGGEIAPEMPYWHPGLDTWRPLLSFSLPNEVPENAAAEPPGPPGPGSDPRRSPLASWSLPETLYVPRVLSIVGRDRWARWAAMAAAAGACSLPVVFSLDIEVPCALALAALVGLAAWRVRAVRRVFEDGCTTDATIQTASIVTRRAGHQSVEVLLVGMSYVVDGARYTKTEEYGLDKRDVLVPGTAVALVYDRDNPARAYVYHAMSFDLTASAT